MTDERNFDHIEITPGEVMTLALQNGSVTLSQYMQWMMTDRSWESVKDVIKEDILNKANQN